MSRIRTRKSSRVRRPVDISEEFVDATFSDSEDPVLYPSPVVPSKLSATCHRRGRGASRGATRGLSRLNSSIRPSGNQPTSSNFIETTSNRKEKDSNMNGSPSNRTRMDTPSTETVTQELSSSRLISSYFDNLGPSAPTALSVDDNEYIFNGNPEDQLYDLNTSHRFSPLSTEYPGILTTGLGDFETNSAVQIQNQSLDIPDLSEYMASGHQTAISEQQIRADLNGNVGSGARGSISQETNPILDNVENPQSGGSGDSSSASGASSHSQCHQSPSAHQSQHSTRDDSPTTNGAPLNIQRPNSELDNIEDPIMASGSRDDNRQFQHPRQYSLTTNRARSNTQRPNQVRVPFEDLPPSSASSSRGNSSQSQLPARNYSSNTNGIRQNSGLGNVDGLPPASNSRDNTRQSQLPSRQYSLTTNRAHTNTQRPNLGGNFEDPPLSSASNSRGNGSQSQLPARLSLTGSSTRSNTQPSQRQNFGLGNVGDLPPASNSNNSTRQYSLTGSSARLNTQPSQRQNLGLDNVGDLPPASTSNRRDDAYQHPERQPSLIANSARSSTQRPNPGRNHGAAPDNSSVNRSMLSQADFQYYVKRQLEFLKVTTMELVDANQRALSMSKRQKTCLCEVEALEQDDGLFSLPVDSVGDLNAMEAQLTDPSYRQKLIIRLSRRGGDNLVEVVSRILYSFLTNNIGRKYTWTGTSFPDPKERLEALPRVIHVINSAVRLQDGFEKASDKSIETEIKEWLRHAQGRFERESGRTDEENIPPPEDDGIGEEGPQPRRRQPRRQRRQRQSRQRRRRDEEDRQEFA